MTPEPVESNIALRRITPENERRVALTAAARPALAAALDERWCEQWFEQFTGGDGSERSLARSVLGLLQNVARVCGVRDSILGRGALEQLLDVLAAEGPARRHFLRLWRWAIAVQCERRSGSRDGIYHLQVRDELQRGLQWFMARLTALRAFDAMAQEVRRDVRRINGMSGEIDIELADLRFVHNCMRAGVAGCELQAFLRLSGHAAREIWLRVEALSEGKPLLTSAGWETWGGRLSDVALARGVDSAGTPAGGRFQCLVPVGVERHRAIVDDLRCFIPYAALALDPTIDRFTARITLFSTDGKVLWNGHEEIPLGRGQPAVRAIPSPQSLGTWPVAAGLGHRCIMREVRRDVRLGRTRILIRGELAITGYRGEELALEIRPLPAAPLNTSLNDADASLVTRHEFVPSSDLMVWDDLSLVWTLADGASLNVELFELTVRTLDGRIICGDLVALPDRPVNEPALSLIDHPSVHRSLILQDVTPQALPSLKSLELSVCGSANTKELKIEFEVSADEWRALRGRVLLHIECSENSALHGDRVVLLSERSYLLPRNRMGGRWYAETRIPFSEIINALPAQQKLDILHCRVAARVFSTDQRLTSAARREIDLAFGWGSEFSENIGRTKAPTGLRLVGYQRRGRQNPGMEELLLEVPASAVPDERCVIMRRRTNHLGQLAGDDLVPVIFSEITEPYGDDQDALLLSIELPRPEGEAAPPIGEVMLFAATGELLEVRSLPAFCQLRNAAANSASGERSKGEREVSAGAAATVERSGKRTLAGRLFKRR